MIRVFPFNTTMRPFCAIHSQAIVIAVAILILVASVFFFRQARDFVGQEFPGVLTLQNGMVGAFGSFDWPGYEAGLRYHDVVGEGAALQTVIFQLKDFLLVFFAPYAAGMFYLILALVIFFVGRHMRGVTPFVLFNLCIAYYFIASFDFHSAHHASWLFLLSFALIPAFMSHFALVFPERWGVAQKHRWVTVIPYILSFAVYAPYVVTFYRAPSAWPFWEGVVVIYAALSYFFWVVMLARSARHAPHETGRIGATYLLFGQIIAFLIPLTAAVAIFIFGRNVPLNVVAPITVVLPIASLFGLILGNLRNAQLKLVQSEKMASLGQLVAGVAHEINNPTTFIYSNVAALRDYVAYLSGAVDPQAAKFKNELSSQEVIEDLGKLVNTVAEGATRIRDIVSDLRRFGHSQDDVVATVDIRSGMQSTLNLLKHDLAEGIAVDLDIAEGLSLTANSGQINQIWMNLLSNAVQACGGAGNIWIQGRVVDGHVVVSVRDDGKGIPPEIIGRIFDPFFTTKPEGKGTGLGLAICQQIAHRWGGEITVHSEEGKGTEVKVTFVT